MRHVTQEGLDLIKRFEGFSPTVYICPAGYPTIGYGHLVRDHESFEKISQEEATNADTAKGILPFERMGLPEPEIIG